MKNPPAQSPCYTSLSADFERSVVDDLMARALESKNLLSIAAGFTDNAKMPAELVGNAVAELVKDGCDDVFQYGSNQGRPALRGRCLEVLGKHPGESLHAIDKSGESVLISNGSQQTMYLAMQTLCYPGDIVLVQAPTYFVFVELARGLGIDLRAMPTTEIGGIDFDALPEFLESLRESNEIERVKAVYFVSYFANPTGYSLSREEKRGLAARLIERELYLPIIEDAAYRELWFGAPAEAPSILSMPEFDAFPKLYLGTFTKPFATGMKVGYGAFSDLGWMQRCARLKSHQDFGTANFNQAIIEKVVLSEEWERFQAQLREHYTQKRDAFVAALDVTDLAERGFKWEIPQGGLLLWARGPFNLDTGMHSKLFEQALAEDVLYVPGSVCMPHKDVAVSTMRLSYGALDAGLFPEALARLGRAIERSAKEL